MMTLILALPVTSGHVTVNVDCVVIGGVGMDADAAQEFGVTV
jgi:hypothetical protein